MSFYRAAMASGALVLLAAMLSTVQPSAQATENPRVEREIATGLTHPWAVGFLPDGTALVTERDSTRILSIKAGVVKELQRIPEAKPNGVQSGLLGLAASPRYRIDKTIFIYYSTETDHRIAKLTLGQRPQPILTGIPLGLRRPGGRLAFGPDGYLYATTGDAQKPELAQDVTSLAGKVLRMRTDGSPAPGNPIRHSVIYSLGHRDPQGITWDSRGRLYVSEAGENTWDELNRVQAGKNYGWPHCEGTCGNPAYVDPIVVWSTDEATPSDLAYYRGSLYMAGNIGKRLWKIPLRHGKPAQPQALYQDTYGKLRAVEPAKDGTLWFTTTNGAGTDKIISTTG